MAAAFDSITPDSSTLPAPKRGTPWRSIFASAPLVVFILASTFLHKCDKASNGEFYPFSNFPMYANPRDRDLEYFFLNDGAGEPIATFKYTGYTAARIKKLMRSASMQWAKENGLQWNKKSAWLTDEIKSEIAARVLAHLRKRSTDRGTPLPETVRLMRGVIFVNEDGDLKDAASELASNTGEIAP